MTILKLLGNLKRVFLNVWPIVHFLGTLENVYLKPTYNMTKIIFIYVLNILLNLLLKTKNNNIKL